MTSVPEWTDNFRPGLQSARQNIADNNIVLTVTEAIAVNSAPFVYYLIYYGTDFHTYTSRARLVATEIPVSVPDALADPEMYFAVTAAQNGISGTVDPTNLSIAAVGDDTLFVLPDATTLTAALTLISTLVTVSSTAGYPQVNGFLLIGGEILSYSSISGSSFVINQRALFGTTAATAAIGAPVDLFFGFETAIGPRIASVASCGLRKPTWLNNDRVGLESITDAGNGTTVTLTWGFAIPPTGFSRIYYNIYRSLNLMTLYSGDPLGITTEQTAVLADLSPRDGYYYGVKATYFISNLVTSSFSEISTDLFAWPAATTLSANLAEGSLGTVTVASTSGYPSSGLLRIGTEIVAYGSKTISSFNLTRRDIFTIELTEDLPAGTAVSFFHGVEDGNTYFWRQTTSWDGYGVDRLPLVAGDGFWGFQYLQDTDGYRNFPVDNLNEDHTIENSDGDAAEPFDFCGFRSTDPVDFLNQDYCGGSYHGNTSRGVGGGLNIFELNQQRQEILLSVTGDIFVLLRRKWTGQTCQRLSHRTEHPRARCGRCYGTMFEGGYTRYVNTREIYAGQANTNGVIAARIGPYNEDLALLESRGLSTEQTDISIWTISIPTIRDRDVLVHLRFDVETGVMFEDFRYEVITVQRNRLLLGKDGAQHATLKRLNKTEEIYKFPITLV